ncbi:MAG: shikimate dehydrogenase, partial [Chloroflexi bacterium]
MEVDGTTRLVGIIGWPVAHSLSPAMHNTAFAALGLNWAYVPLPVPPGAVEDALRGLKALGFAGANVTIPHKEAVIPYLDEVTPAARAMGAVNTLLVRRENGTTRLVGDNTDAIGFLEDLRAAGFDPAGRRCLVLGAGGGARAVVYALAQAGAHVTLHNRTPRRAQALVQALIPHLPGASLTALPADVRLTDLDLAPFDLLVNATPVGMWPHPEASPWPDEAPL